LSILPRWIKENPRCHDNQAGNGKIVMSEASHQLASLVDISDHQAVFTEIRFIARLIFPRFDFSLFDGAREDILRLFKGEYPRYRESNLAFHDLTHTTAVTLAGARLMHGAVEAGHSLTEKDFNMGLISGLMHDTGYIQREEDTEGTGAKYTLVHVDRSIDFLNEYYRDNQVFQNSLADFRDILHCTGLNTKVTEIRFANRTVELLGKILGTADLLGQMAERRYLEKLLDLYHEFVEGGITTFTSQLDLLDKTRGFYQMTRKRFSEELGNAYLFSRYHFRSRWGIDEDLYTKCIENNLAYLDHVLAHHRHDYRRRLRRQYKHRNPAVFPARPGNADSPARVEL
jgi:hypothetical protein